MDTHAHERKWMRLRPEACKALQAVCPEMQTLSNAASTFHVAADVFAIAWAVARAMEDAVKAARWDKWPLGSVRAEELVEWLLKSIEKTPTSWAGLLLRAELARDAHDNGDDALTIIVGDLSASTREADNGVAAGKKPLPYMAHLTYGALQSSTVGFRAIAWMELNRAAQGARLRSRVASAAVKLAYDMGILVDGGDDWDVEDEETAVAAARVIAQACGTYDLWLYSQQGVLRTSMAHEELNAAYDTTMDGRNPFYTARISAMISLTPTLRRYALKGAPTAALVGLLVQYGGACLPPHQTGQAFLATPAGIRTLEQAISHLGTWFTLPAVAALDPPQRAAAFVTKMADNVAQTGGDRSGQLGPSDATGGGPGHGQRVLRAKDHGHMPGIITDAIAFAEAGTGCNYVALLAVLLMGRTTASPNRKPTGLSHQLAAGKMPGHLVDGRLAITTTAWAQYGSEYLGNYLGKALIKLGICSAKQARGMKFATLAKQVFDPTAVIDYVNDVLLVAIEHMHTAGSNGQASMGRVDYSKRYKDILLNLRLPPLVSALYQCLGQQHEGEGSVHHVINNSNSVVLWNGGITALSNACLSESQQQLIGGVAREAALSYSATLDFKNPEAAIPEVQLRGDATAGARGAWSLVTEGIARAAEERQQRAFTETLGGTISAPTTAAYAGMAAQAPAVKPQDAADKKAEEQRKRARDSASGEWVDGADTGAKQQQRRDLSGAKHTYSGEGGKVLAIGPDSEGGYTCYDADKARKALPAGQCVAHFFTFSLNAQYNCPMGCDDPTHDDHKGVDPTAHRWQADMPKVSDFNLNASDRGKEKNASDRGKEKSKGIGKDGGKGKGKGKDGKGGKGKGRGK